MLAMLKSSQFVFRSIRSAACKMSTLSQLPKALREDLLSSQGKTISCKAAVAWEPKKPLDVTEIQVATPKAGV